MNITEDFKQSLQKAIEHLIEDLKSIRTGRATPALLENLIVEAYGGSTKMPLSQLATISTENATTLHVVPFDPGVVANIEKAILKSTLGLSPRVQGKDIFVSVPPLSQEQREKFIKLVGSKVEDRKNILRGQRDDARRKTKAQLENKEIAEDAKFRLEKEIDNITQDSMTRIQNIRERKEQEIREV